MKHQTKNPHREIKHHHEHSWKHNLREEKIDRLALIYRLREQITAAEKAGRDTYDLKLMLLQVQEQTK